jgi:hypothetical protein
MTTATLCRHYSGTADCPPMCLAMFGERYREGKRETEKPIIEPDGDSREVAAMLRQQYLALTAEGFNENQACIILGQMMAAGAVYKAFGGGKTDGD